MSQWTSFKFSAIKFFSQSFGELTRCSQNMSCGQCKVSKHLAYRYILKSIVNKLEGKNQKFSFFGTWINFNQVCNSHAICRASHPWHWWNSNPCHSVWTHCNQQRVSVIPLINFCFFLQKVSEMFLHHSQICFFFKSYFLQIQKDNSWKTFIWHYSFIFQQD